MPGSNSGPVCWAELLPHEFMRRRAEMPVVYLPMGLCEPHGQIAALGLDLIKAEALCEAAARAFGGIVAPPTGFHIHECGPSARWLHDNVGEVEAHLSSVGPSAFLHGMVHQLRAAANAGFSAALLVSGHAGAHAADLADAAEQFGIRFRFRCRYLTDVELAVPLFAADHAGPYEISLLQHIRPDLVNWERARLAEDGESGGRFALAPDARNASAEFGARVFSHLVGRLGDAAAGLLAAGGSPAAPLSIQQAEGFWEELHGGIAGWKCARPRAGQEPVPAESRWKPGEILQP